MGGGVLGDRLKRAGAQFRGREVGEFVECASRDAKRDTDQRYSHQREERQSPQWPVVAGRLEERADGVFVGNAETSGDDVVAAGGAQPQNVPVVDDVGVRAGEEREAPVGALLGNHPRRIAVEHEHPGQQPFGMATTAGKRPAAIDGEATPAIGHGPPGRGEHRGRREVGVRAEQFVGDGGLEPSGECWCAGTDGRDPARGTVGAGQFLDHLDELDGGHFKAAERAWLQRAEDPRRAQPLDQIDRHCSHRLSVVGALRDFGRQGTRYRRGTVPVRQGGGCARCGCHVGLLSLIQ